MKKMNVILQRLIQMIPVLLGISLVTFVLAQAVPGDPARLVLGPRATQEALAAMRERYGLDRPIWEQYLIYLKHLSQGDWGNSITFRIPVWELLRSRFQQ